MSTVTRQVWSLNEERLDIDAIRNASDGELFIALRVRGPRGGRIADLYLNAGQVEQLESALANAKAELGLP